MKLIWEEQDIIPGTMVRVPSSRETWIIGFYAAVMEKNGRYTVISLSDGMALKGMSKKDTADLLTRGGYWAVDDILDN